MLINYLIKQVNLFDDKIQIQLNSPIRISPDDEKSGFSIYSETFDMITFKYAKTEPYTRKAQLELYV